MMKRKIIILAILVSFGALLQGCLAVETKEYSYKLKKGKSGQGSIRFINIMSDQKDSTGNAESDYRELIDTYLNGNKLSEELPGVTNIKKRLFEEDNQLCGEITFDFEDITKLKFYKYKEAGPWCYFLGFTPMGIMGGSESYFSSNGTFGGDKMPAIFWDSDNKDFNFKTTLTQPSKSTSSLLEIWKHNSGK